MGLANPKVPVVIASSLICLVAGLAVGIVVTAVFGDQLFPKKTEDNKPDVTDGVAPPGRTGAMAPGAPMGGRGGAGGPGGGGGQARGPNSKAQLALLVTKLDLLTAKPLTVQLDTDQKKKVQEQLAGLDGKEELTEEEAKKKVEALQELLKDQRDTLEEVGYRWEGGQGGGGGGRGAGGRGEQPKNPFKEGNPNKHLKDLLQRVEPPKTE